VIVVFGTAVLVVATVDVLACSRTKVVAVGDTVAVSIRVALGLASRLRT